MLSARLVMRTAMLEVGLRHRDRRVRERALATGLRLHYGDRAVMLRAVLLLRHVGAGALRPSSPASSAWQSTDQEELYRATMEEAR
jgi:hypothetical protein